MAQFQDLRLAVLIDADNIPRRSIKGIMEELTLYGTPTIKRIYGDWTSQQLGGMKKLLLECALTPIQQYGYTTGKNSTDSAMIIDAMDILYTDNVDGFCLVSSDSDFTRLATRLREAGKTVIGIGEKKTPSPFIVACDKFIYVEVIKSRAEAAQESEKPKQKQKSEQKTQTKKQETKPQPKAEPKPEPEPEPEVKAEVKKAVPDSVVQLIADSIAAIADEEGYAFLGELGNLLLKKQPDFDSRNFGYSKLTNLLKSLPRFEVNIRQTNYPHIKHMYVRDKLAESD